MFVFSLKQPLFARHSDRGPEHRRPRRRHLAGEHPPRQAGPLHHRGLPEDPRGDHPRQQQEMLELSTPVVKLWDGVLALPLIGTLDSAADPGRSWRACSSGSSRPASDIAIIDITGVPTVDTLIAQHLLKTVTAARLMGADCIISGIRPQIAQTIVHLGRGPRRRHDQGHAWPTPSPWRLSADAAGPSPARRRTGPRQPEDRAWTASRSSGWAFLLVTIQVDMHDRLAMTLQDDLTEQIARDGARGVLHRHLRAGHRRLVHRPDDRRTSPRMSRVLDAETVVVGHAAGGGHHPGGAGPVAARASARRSTSSGGCSSWLRAGGRRRPGEAGDARAGKTESVPIRRPDDVVLVRQAVRKWAVELGFSLVDQTKMVTAASELARNTLDLRRGRDGPARGAGGRRPPGPAAHLRGPGPGHPRHRPPPSGTGTPPGTGWGSGFGGARSG